MSLSSRSLVQKSKAQETCLLLVALALCNPWSRLPFSVCLSSRMNRLPCWAATSKSYSRSMRRKCWFIQLIEKVSAKKLFLSWLLRYFSSLITWWLWVLSVHKRIEMRKCDIFKILKIILTSSRQKESIWKMKIKGKMVGKIQKRQLFAHSFLGITLWEWSIRQVVYMPSSRPIDPVNT